MNLNLCFKYIAIILLVVSCKSIPQRQITKIGNDILIDLSNTTGDQVNVYIKKLVVSKDSIDFFIPKIIPGTYDNYNYGRYIKELKAYDKRGEYLPVSKISVNTWRIQNAKQLDHINYLVDDTFDEEWSTDENTRIFSPAGTNIIKDQNYILNLHGFVGYFSDSMNKTYSLKVKHHKNIDVATSSEFRRYEEGNFEIDQYLYNRYSDLIDEPIIYGKLDNISFKVDDMEVLFSVYSPNGIHKAKSLLPTLKKMMIAQKNFMRNINSTKKYSVLLYLSTADEKDAQGFGALEHNNSTVVVLPEILSEDLLQENLIDIVAHEFFHIITPLNIHSEEIQNFDYNSSSTSMSKHLWMYEGTTEYFAQLFQVYEGLIDETEFYNRIYTKLENKNRYDKTMSFTEMSANILESPYKDNYMNIYEKGALISMCIDILIRENTQGKKGIIDLMEALSKKYGNNTPFQDDELIGIIGDLTAPNVEFFLNKHVVGGTPIDYNKYLLKVGLQLKQSKIETGYFINKYDPYISPDKIHNRIYFNSNHEYNSFLTDLKIQPNDILVSINNRKFNLDNIRELFLTSRKWKKGEQIQMTINRGGVEFTTSTKIIAPPFITSTSIESINENELTSIQKRLRSRWLNL